MAFLKFANAIVEDAKVGKDKWDQIRKASSSDAFNKTGSSVDLGEYADPSKYLLSHCTIIASVDVDEVPNVKVGEKVQEGGKSIKRLHNDYHITPETSKFVNANGDAWERELLMSTYRTFIGAENYCFSPETTVLMEDGTYKPIKDIKVGDKVVSAEGNVKPVVHKFERDYEGRVCEVYVDRFKDPIIATDNHPFYHIDVEAPSAVSYAGSKFSSQRRYYKDQITSFLREGDSNLGGRYKGLNNVAKFLKKNPNSTCNEIASGTGISQSPINAFFRKYPDAFLGRYLKTGEKPSLKGKYRRSRVWSLKNEDVLPVMEITAGITSSPIGDIEKEDTFYLVGPQRKLGSSGVVGKDLATLLGYYLAEGCQNQKDYDQGISLTFGDHETQLVEHAVSLLNKEFPCATVRVDKDPSVLRVVAGDSEMAAWFRKYGGHLSHKKRVHTNVFNWSREELIHLLSAWLTGDGDYHKGTHRARGATVSQDLAYQMHRISELCGIKSSVVFEPQKIGEAVSSITYVNKDGTSHTQDIIPRHHLWTVLIASDYLEELFNNSLRFEYLDRDSEKRNEFAWYEDRRVHRIKEIKKRDYVGKVYNIEVEDDHSYVVDHGISVKNCEHIQIPELSKGKVIDAVARDLGDTVYVDILVATNRKHGELVADIEAGKINTLSMGCSIQYSICTKCGNVAADETELCFHVKYEKGNHFHDHAGKKRVVAELCFPPDTRVVMDDGTRCPISDIKKGSKVLTHEGVSRPVMDIIERDYEGDFITLDVLGHPKSFQSTPKHPYLVLQRDTECNCGCGQLLKGIRTGSQQEYSQKYIQGHNPNKKGSTCLDQEFNFEFQNAEDIEEGDILALPIPQKTIEPEDLNKDRAELLGWFLAEGCFQKDLQGEYTGIIITLNANDEKPVANRIAKLLEQEFSPEFSGNMDTQAKVIEILRDDSKHCSQSLANDLGISKNAAKLALQRLRKNGYVSSKRACQGDKRYLPIQSTLAHVWKITDEGLNTDHHYNKPRIHLYDRNNEDGKKLVVCYTNRRVSEFMFKHAGEYSDQKKLSENSIYWPKEIQHQLLKSYVHGDGTVDAQRRHSVSSTSVDLIDQMQLIAARLGIWTRRQIIWNGKATQAYKIHEGMRDDLNFLPRHELHFQRSDCTDQFFEMVSNQKKCTSTPAWRREGEYFLYKVRSKSKTPYIGKVYNLSVNNINSYLVEGIAVHNCGYKDDPESVTFIEASWVANPAFKGAVLRNILNSSSDITPEEREATATKQAELLAASPMLAEFLESQNIDQFVRTAAKDVLGRELESIRILKEELNQRLASTSKKSFGFDDDEEDDEEGEEEGSPIEEIRKDIKKELHKDIKKEITEDMKNELGLNPREVLFDDKGDSGKPNVNDNIISGFQAFASRYSSEIKDQTRLRNVFSVIYAARENNWNKVAGIDHVSNRDIVAAMYLKDRDYGTNPLPSELYTCLSKVGGASNYNNVHSFLNACHLALGRKTSVGESKVLIRRSKLLK